MTSRPITFDEHKLIIQTMYSGGCGFRPNPTIALILTIEGSCGLRINDCLRIRLRDIYRTDDNNYRLKIQEQKTGKYRDIVFFADLYYMLSEYCVEYGRKRDELVFDITSRAVSKYLKKVVEYLGLYNVSTHSWRKMFAMELYSKTDLYTTSLGLLHSNINTTVRYLAKNPSIDKVLEECGSKLVVINKRDN